MKIYKIANGRPEKVPGGIPLKKGQLVRVWGLDGVEDGQIFEVEEDVPWVKEFNSWGSVKLKGYYPWVWTHKGGIEVVK